MRSRVRRVALVAGLGFVVLSCGVGVVLPAVLEPQPPWADVEAEREAWDSTLDTILLAACGLGTTGLLLVTVGLYKHKT